MIAALRGSLLDKTSERIIVDVHGVGYDLLVANHTLSLLPQVGEEVLLYVHTNVREDAITLFGFLAAEEKELFLILKTVSGIGPKLALTILSGLRVADICQAIAASDIPRLTTLPGVGKKTAERICVELKEKVAHLGTVSPDQPASLATEAGSDAADALSALLNLGYSDSIGRGALAAVKKKWGEEEFSQMPVKALIREALRTLA